MSELDNQSSFNTQDNNDDLENVELYETDENVLHNFNSCNKKEQSSESGSHIFLREFFSLIKIFAAAFIIAMICNKLIIVNAQVPTGSMNNTIMDNDRVIGFRLSYLFSEPKTGDIIIFKFPDNETEDYVKRVIGTPGDIVEIKNGHVYVNDKELDEPYIKEPMYDNGSDQIYVVPEDSYFVLGDNRNDSADSRVWVTTHYVKKEKILAKVVLRYYNGYTGKIDFKSF